MPRTTWAPGGIEDVHLVLVPATPDPDSRLYKKDWVLVKSADALEACEGWSYPGTIAVVCAEAVRERPWLTAYRTAAYFIIYIWREDVEDMVEGPVAAQDRYRLRDLGYAFDPRGKTPVSGESSTHQSTAGGPSGSSTVTVTPSPILAGSAPARSTAARSVSARTTLLL